MRSAQTTAVVACMLLATGLVPFSTAHSVGGDGDGDGHVSADAPREALIRSVTGLEQGKSGYSSGEAVVVECLDRDEETGEHITDDKGLLRYKSFPVCSETGWPLAFKYGVDQDIKCTVDFVSDSLFHMLEYYVHSDVPLACRIPTIPLAPSTNRPHSIGGRPKDERVSGVDRDTSVVAAQSNQFGIDNPLYTPLVLTLTGLVEPSHLHIAKHLNVVIHTEPIDLHDPNRQFEQAASFKKKHRQKTKTTSHPFDPVQTDGAISAAAGYSASSRSGSRVVIGDKLEFRFAVRWFGSSFPPPSSTGRDGLKSGLIGPAVDPIVWIGFGFVVTCVWVYIRLARGLNALPRMIEDTIDSISRRSGRVVARARAVTATGTGRAGLSLGLGGRTSQNRLILPLSSARSSGGSATVTPSLGTSGGYGYTPPLSGSGLASGKRD